MNTASDSPKLGSDSRDKQPPLPPPRTQRPLASVAPTWKFAVSGGKKNKPIFHVGRTESWPRLRGFFSLPNSFGNEYELRRRWMVLLWLVPSSFPGVATEKSTRRFYSICASNHVYRNNSSFFNNTQVHQHEASESFVLFIHQPASSFHHLPVGDGYFKVT